MRKKILLFASLCLVLAILPQLYLKMVSNKVISFFTPDTEKAPLPVSPITVAEEIRVAEENEVYFKAVFDDSGQVRKKNFEHKKLVLQPLRLRRSKSVWLA